MKKSPVETQNEEISGEPNVPETPASGEAAELTPEALVNLKEKGAKADEHWERLLRTTADFDNFKKRAAREKQDAIKYANENLLQKLIPVLDNFDMAMSATQSKSGDSQQSLQTGVAMILQQLKSAVQDAGLEEIDAAGKVFDPNLHEAVSQKESTEAPDGSVLQQLRKGYKLKDRLLRPATVIVAKAPSA